MKEQLLTKSQKYALNCCRLNLVVTLSKFLTFDKYLNTYSLTQIETNKKKNKNTKLLLIVHIHLTPNKVSSWTVNIINLWTSSGTLKIEISTIYTIPVILNNQPIQSQSRKEQTFKLIIKRIGVVVEALVCTISYLFV